jgi:hypothetical protein
MPTVLPADPAALEVPARHTLRRRLPPRTQRGCDTSGTTGLWRGWSDQVCQDVGSGGDCCGDRGV